MALFNDVQDIQVLLGKMVILAKKHDKQVFIDMVDQHGISIVAVFIIRATISLGTD